MIKKKAQSDVVATLIIVLLTIVAGAVLLAYLMPVVKNWISGGDCFQFNDKLNVVNDPAFTCYNTTTHLLHLKVSVGDIDEKTKNRLFGMVLIVQGPLNSNTYTISPSNSDPHVSMSNGDPVQVPPKNSERVYNITGLTFSPNSTVIYPIIDKSRKCTDAGSIMDFIPVCSY
jgi:flagellin-like protein